MQVWKIMFLSKWVMCRFDVNLPRCIYPPQKKVCVFSCSIKMRGNLLIWLRVIRKSLQVGWSKVLMHIKVEVFCFIEEI